MASMRLCDCGNTVKLMTSWTNDNPGRRYFCCATWQRGEGCGFFMWHDPVMCPRSKALIPGLLKSMNGKDAKIEMLVARQKRMTLAIVFLSLLLVIGWSMKKDNCSSCQCGALVRV